MPEKKRHRFRRIFLIFVLLAVIVVLWVGLSTGPPPELAVRTAFDPDWGELALLGPSNPVTITAREPRRGVGRVRVELLQGETVQALGEAAHPFRSAWKPWRTAPRPEETLELVVSRDVLQEGPATLRVVASRSSGFLRWPEPVVLERSFIVRLTAPSLAVHSTNHYVAQGGCEVVVYQVGDKVRRSGVRVGDWFFPGHPLPGAGPSDRFALFAVPYDVATVSNLRLEAEDAVGNRAEQRFVDRFFERPLGSDTIRLDDRFLARVVPDILSQTPALRPQGSLLDQYLAINRELRSTNDAELRQLAAHSREAFLWRGPFVPQRGAKATAAFAEHRIYVYDGNEVDQQDHLGFDLASTARAPIQAGNTAVVVKAGWFGIYGNTIVLDHGYGLHSLYGHLSSVGVSEGEEVKRGQEIGRTGATGLAGGDHLHFAILLQGLPVNPREWWDGHWIQDRLRLKLGEALPGA